MRRSAWSGLLLLLLALSAGAAVDNDDEQKPWAEQAVNLPLPPKAESLLYFVPSEATANRFAIDPASVSVGEDGVVRYTLVVQTAGGARNVTYEGMRCQTREYRLYASGRLDGSWSPSRNREWVRIRNLVANRQHAALFLEYFCPGGVIVDSATEALAALRSGVHPRNQQSVN